MFNKYDHDAWMLYNYILSWISIINAFESAGKVAENQNFGFK